MIVEASAANAVRLAARAGIVRVAEARARRVTVHKVLAGTVVAVEVGKAIRAAAAASFVPHRRCCRM